MFTKNDLTDEEIKKVCDKAGCFGGDCQIKKHKFGTNPKSDCINLDDIIKKYFEEGNV